MIRDGSSPEQAGGKRYWTPNGLEMSRPASSSIVAQTRFAAAGRVGSIELLGLRLPTSGLPCLEWPLAEYLLQVRCRAPLEVENVWVNTGSPGAEAQFLCPLNELEFLRRVWIQIGTCPREDHAHSCICCEEENILAAVDLDKMDADGAKEQITSAH